MKLTVREAMNALAGLGALDGTQRVVKEGAAERVVVEPNKLDGPFRFTLARNIHKLRAVSEAHDTARNALIKELSGGGEKVPDERLVEFGDRYKAILEMTEDVALTKITEADLKLDVNPIAATTLSLLVPLID